MQLTRICELFAGLDITNGIAVVCEILGIEVVDHVRTTVVIEALRSVSLEYLNTARKYWM
jgi:hypothetical protein